MLRADAGSGVPTALISVVGREIIRATQAEHAEQRHLRMPNKKREAHHADPDG
jgi:hypothetical protein